MRPWGLAKLGEHQDHTFSTPSTQAEVTPQTDPATNQELAQKYPLNLMSPKSHAFLNSSYGNLPEQLNHAGEQTLLIHPQDASMRGIAHGAVVRVFNDRGAFAAVAMVTDDVMPGVVVAPLGYWRRLSRAQATVQAVNSGKYADFGRAPDLLRQPGRGGTGRGGAIRKPVSSNGGGKTMAVIDADTHVIETEHTWDYMDPSEQQFRPLVVTPKGSVDENTGTLTAKFGAWPARL